MYVYTPDVVTLCASPPVMCHTLVSFLSSTDSAAITCTVASVTVASEYPQSLIVPPKVLQLGSSHNYCIIEDLPSRSKQGPDTLYRRPIQILITDILCACQTAPLL